MKDIEKQITKSENYPIIDLMKLLNSVEAESEKSNLNEISISDNNGKRIYF